MNQTEYKYFSPNELKCKCGKCDSTGHEMDDNFMQRLVMLRMQFNRPIIITSAYRCPSYNSEISDTGEKGPHSRGKAVDIKIYGTLAYALVEMAYELSFTGIGVKQRGPMDERFVHLDTCTHEEVGTRPWIWSY